MIKQCTQCQANFEITDEDLTFLKKISPVFNGKNFDISPSALCQYCRHQRRFAFRDERKLYSRKCDFSGENIISIYSPDKPYKVYKSNIWWGDKWDPLEYGREFNPNASFIEQWQSLSNDVPKMQYSEYSNLNCPYGNRICNCKNCYMCFNLDTSEDSYYCEIGHGLKDCLDCISSRNLEGCNNCLYSRDCFNSSFLWSCTNVSDSLYCFDCKGCHDIIGCWNLRNKNYCIWNIQYSKEEYIQKKEELLLSSWNNCEKIEKEFIEHKTKEAIHRCSNIFSSENCTGDSIFESKNCENCFEILQGEDLFCVINVDWIAKDCRYANNINDHSELIYESMSTSASKILFSFNTWESNDVFYSECCKSCSNIFGCCGLKHKKYCILNKEYSKEEYDTIVPRIISKMREDGEWGEFCPIKYSPLCYNETQAYERFPMTKEEVIEQGWNWKNESDEMPDVDRIINATQIPETTDDVPDDILNWAIRCMKTKRPYKFIRAELEYCRKYNLPLPRLHPDERHRQKLAIMNPWKLWNRKCNKCSKEMQTTYSPKRTEMLYCEECYLKEVY